MLTGMRGIIFCLGLLLAVPAWANSLESLERTACQVSHARVEQMPDSEKLCRAFVRALIALPEATAEQAQSLLTPENLAFMAATTALWLGSQGVPIVGQAVDTALLSIGIIVLAAQAADVAQAIWAYVNRARGARSQPDLDAAASHLSRALATVGLNVVALVLLKKAGAEKPQRPSQQPMRLASKEGALQPGTGSSAVMIDASNATMVAEGRGPRGGSRTGIAALAKKLDLKAFAAWIEQAPKQRIRENSNALRFQVKHGGPEEILVSGGGERVWADGADLGRARLLEIKHIDSPDKSPYVPDSLCNEEIRALIREQTLDQFRRYAAVLQDKATPAVALEVITNEVRAVPFFKSLMQETGLVGDVVVKP
jgi:hypothetical protein